MKDVNAILSGNVAIAGTNRVDNILITGTPITSPAIIAGGGPLTSLATTYGTASSSTSFTLTGSGLGTTITVGPLAGFEFSSGGAYSGTLTEVSATGPTTINVRLAATTAVGTYSGNIPCVSGSTTLNVPMVSSTVNKTTLTITGAASRAYGTVLTPGSGSSNFTPSGLRNGESIGSVTIAYTTGSGNGNDAADAVGTYTGKVTPSAATGGTFTASNYNISYAAGTMTVTQASLSVTASDQSKTYGGTAPTSGTLNTNYTVVGLKNSDAVSGVTLGYSGSPAGNLATATVAGSPYTITPSAVTFSTGSGSNYSITYPTGTLTVTTAAIIVTATGTTKTYGTALTAGTSSVNFTHSGEISGEAVTSVTLTPDAAGLSTTTAAGAAYTITPSLATGSGGFLESNYNVTYVAYNGTVGKAALTVTGGNQSVCYGTLASTVTGAGTNNISGYKNSDTPSVITGTVNSYSTTYTASTAAGTEGITITPIITGLSATNYSFNAANGSITVNIPSSTDLSPGDYVWTGSTSNDCSNKTNWLTYNGSSFSVATSTPDYTINVSFLACATNNFSITTSLACKDLSIASEQTLNMSAGQSLTISGNWFNSGTFNSGSGTVTFNGTSGTQTLSGNSNFYNLTLNNTGATTSFGSSTITIANTLTATAGTMNGATSTIIFTGASGSIDGAGAKNFNNLQINSGASITNSSGGNIYINGSYTNNGTFTQSTTPKTYFSGTTQPLSGSGSSTFLDITIQGTSTVNAGSHSFTVGTGTFSVSPSGTFDGGTATVTFSGSPSVMGSGGGHYYFNNVNISGTLSNAANKDFSVKGNWTNNGTYTNGSETVTFNASSGTQTIGGSTTFYNLTLNNSGTSFGNSIITLANTLTVSAGTMNGGTSTIIFTGASGSMAGGNAKNFYNLQINNGATITQTSGTSVTVANSYINNGTFLQNTSRNITFQTNSQTLSGNGTSTFGEVIISNAITLNAGAHNFSVSGGSIDITNASGIFNGGNATVTFSGNTSFGTGNGTYNFNNIIISGTLSDATNNKNFNVAGNWTNNGTYTKGIETISFNGSSQQTIKSGGSQFNSITLNNTSNTGISDINLSDVMTINGLGTFTKGIVTYSGTGSLTFGDNATTSGGSTASFVSGIVTKTGANAFTFPIGDASTHVIFAPIGIATPSSASNITAQYSFAHSLHDCWDAGAMCDLSTINHCSDIEHWELTSSTSGVYPAVTLYWNPATGVNHGITTPGDIIVAHWTGSCWESLGGTATGSASTGSISSSLAFTHYSDITLGSKGIDNPLPINLLYFNGVCKDDKVDISWSTATETNNDHFTIERSSDATNWQFVRKVAGAGNSNTVLNYNITDENPLGGISYYRLKQTDFDGQSETYSPAAVSCSDDAYKASVSYFPNPFTSEVVVDLKNITSENAVIYVYDVFGSKVFTKILSQEDLKRKTVNMNLGGLDRGIYTVEFRSDLYSGTSKLIKN